MNTSEILNRAADLIEERGWSKGVDAWTPESGGGLCLEGAIMAAAGITRHIDAPNCHAYRSVRLHLGDRCRNAVLPGADDDRLWAWNDTVARTAEEVIEVLRACALIEASREEQDAAYATYAPNLVSVSS